MSKVYRVCGSSPRSLSVYERTHLEEIAVDVTEVDGYDETSLRERVMIQVRREAEQKVKEAYAEGLRRGIEAGKLQFAQSVAESAIALKAAAATIGAAREEFLNSIEPQIIEVAGAIARRILQRESEEDPGLIGRTVRRALEHLIDRENVVIHLNPKDAEALRAQKIALLDEFEGVRNIVVQSDPEIGPGGCIVETERVHVDARIDAQLEQIIEALRDGLNHVNREDTRDES
jgi:flagellar biosynthesis/type III secretory pathway protein FliH